MNKDRFGIPLELTGTQFWRRPAVTRRVLFQHAASAVSGYFFLPELDWRQRSARAQGGPARARNVIFIMMRGGPSQVDTFDLKQGAWTPANLDVQGSIPFGDETFDVVTMWSCIEHVRDPETSLREAARFARGAYDSELMDMRSHSRTR